MLGYSALGAGARFLPTTVLIVLIAPLAGRLTDRIGARLPITVGLLVLTVSMYLFAQIDAATTFSDILPAFLLMGVGIALVMSPMSTAAMNAVSVRKAGIASGILSMMRMIGGTVGVAAIGAIFQARIGTIDPAALAAGASQARVEFIDALASAMLLAAAVAALGALVAVLTIRGRAEPAGVGADAPAADRTDLEVDRDPAGLPEGDRVTAVTLPAEGDA